ncbi:MAG: hypothetical protein E6R04_10390 [Spirochaetes bacterium]|nr:MAG: hypothetical protein E6R04_10390 [Spirochaetota bacterium]
MAKTIDQLLREYRRALLGIDRAVAEALVREYRRRIARLAGDMAAVEEALRRAGAIEDAARWARDSDAVGRLLAAAEQGMGEFGEFAAQQIDRRIHDLVDLAAEHDDALTYASIVGPESVTPATAAAIRAAFTAIPVEAVQNIVGALQPGSPLRELFDRFGVVFSRKLGEALVQGLTRGHGAEQVGRALRQSLDGDAARALTIARTEMHRAYRTASLERYRANPRVYAGWRWIASLDRRTCPVCVSKHGSVHSLDEDFGSHPNCRCRPVGETRKLTEITGDTSPEMRELEERLEDAKPAQDTGQQWFAKLGEDAQREILGPKKLDAYRKGKITLDDVVVEKADPRWGLGHRTASMREALANANARRDA